MSHGRLAPRFHTCNTVLVLKGRIVDKVTFITPPIHSKGTFFGDKNPELDTLLTDLLWTWSQVLLNLDITIDNAAALPRAIACDRFPAGLSRESPPDTIIDASSLLGILCYLTKIVGTPLRLRETDQTDVKAQYD